VTGYRRRAYGVPKGMPTMMEGVETVEVLVQASNT
jgi:hypothetical protein